MSCRCVNIQRRSACGKGLCVNSGFKISIRVLTWGHVSVSLNIARRSGEEEFLLIKHDPTTEKNITQRHGEASLHSLGTSLPWSTSLFSHSPSAELRTHRETPSTCSSVWQRVSFSKQSEELQSRSPRFSKTTISRTWRILDGQDAKAHIFQINTAVETIFKNKKNPWNPRQTTKKLELWVQEC